MVSSIGSRTCPKTDHVKSPDGRVAPTTIEEGALGRKSFWVLAQIICYTHDRQSIPRLSGLIGRDNIRMTMGIDPISARLDYNLASVRGTYPSFLNMQSRKYSLPSLTSFESHSKRSSGSAGGSETGCDPESEFTSARLSISPTCQKYTRTSTHFSMESVSKSIKCSFGSGDRPSKIARVGSAPVMPCLVIWGWSSISVSID